MERLSIKRLTKSDLTFLKDYFDGPAGKKVKQKALNLNSDIFVDEFYPDLKAATSSTKIHIDLIIFGPGGADPITLARKIRKGDGYKNWRLNGEFIHTPDETPHRFDDLREEDIAIIGFVGSPEPTHVYLDFIASSNSSDTALYALLDSRVPRISSHNRNTMVKISSHELKSILTTAGVLDSHPICRFILDEDLIEAVQGDSDAQLRVFRRSGRSMTKEELTEAKQHADRTGDLGEEFVNAYLQELKDTGSIADFSWISQENAIAPYDFTITYNDGTLHRVDVKSTKNGFATGFHVSMAELLTMQDPIPYDIYRVYDVNVAENTATLRIAPDFNQYAEDIINALAAVPYNVRPDSLSCQPTQFTFDPASIALTLE